MYSALRVDEESRGRDSGFFLKVAVVRQPPAERSDAELLQAMIANEPWGWREFQRRFDRLIQRCITKVTRRFAAMVSPDDVRDIYGALYLSLVSNDRHKLRSFDPARGNRFSSWIGLLAINCAYDFLRSRKREPNRGTLTEAEDVVCTLPDPYECAVESQRATLAADLLEGLSARDRAFAALYFGEELDPNEIASRLNISVKTVYSKKHKIQTRLARLEAVLSGAKAGIAAEPDAEAAG